MQRSHHYKHQTPGPLEPVYPQESTILQGLFSSTGIFSPTLDLKQQ